MSDNKQLVKNLHSAGKKFSEANHELIQKLDEIHKKLPENGILQDMTDYEIGELKGLFDDEKELIEGVYAWTKYIEKNLENVGKIYFMLGGVVGRHNSFELFCERKKNGKE